MVLFFDSAEDSPEAEMDELQCAVASLLDESLDGRPTEDLKTILGLLQAEEIETTIVTPTKRSIATLTTSSTSQSLRQKLGSNIDGFKDRLCEMMAERVGLDDLLPMTYDDEANEVAMGDHNALTLTNSSMLAAQVYARLLAIPGAFSAGLVDLHVLSELPRILSRWRTECTGREWAIMAKHKHNVPSMSSKNKQPTKRARSMGGDDDDDDDDFDTESHDGSESPFIIEIADDNAWTERQLIVRGLELALLVANLPAQKHFAGWNKDCRTAVINAIGSSLATTAALFSYERQRQASTVDAKLGALATKVIDKSSQALRTWMDADGSISADVALEIIIDVQRNLYSVITLNESDLPNGDEGLLSAGQVASDAFQSLSFSVTSYSKSRGNGERRSSAVQTPMSSRTRRSSSADTMMLSSPMTNRKGRAELRQSVGSSSTPLKMKIRDSICTTGERRASYLVEANDCSLHPLVLKVASMMQRLLTDPRNSAAKVRWSTCAAVEQCLVASVDTGLVDLVLRWIVKIFHSNADFHRLAAIRLGAFALVNQSFSHGTANMSWEDGNYACEKDISAVLMSALQRRLCDLKQTVRIAAANELIALSERIVKEGNPDMVRLLYEKAEDMAESFRSLVLEEVSTVGKISFIKSLVSLLSMGEQLNLSVTAEDIEVLVVACQDRKSVMLRAAAADGLTSLLDLRIVDNSEEFILTQWSQAILPILLDPEMRVQTKALQLVDRIILDAVTDENAGTQCRRAWIILSAISHRSMLPGGSKVEFDALRFAVTKRTDIAQLIKCIRRVGDEMYESGAMIDVESGLWCLFSAVMQHKSDINDVTVLIKRLPMVTRSFEFASRAFYSLFDTVSMDQNPTNRDAARAYCLEVMAVLAISGTFSTTRARDLLDTILSSFQLQSAFIAAAVRLFMALIISTYEKHEVASTMCKEAINKMLQRCEDEIVFRIDKRHFAAKDELLLSRVLCTTGELSMVGFVFEDTCGKTDMTAVISLYGLDIRPSDRLRTAILTISSGSAFLASLRGHALVALGKMCIRDERLTKDSLGVFVQALQDEGNPAIRSNAILCMGDLLVRYTNLTDRFLPEMAACLQAGASSDNNASQVLVRKHAILVLSDLLLQDYIKWRGGLFPCFLLATIDNDDDVALLAESMICGPLKKEKLFSSHFVESLFIFNSCEAHDMMNTLNGLDGPATGTTLFSGQHLIGRKNSAARQTLYELMISQLTDAEKIAVVAGMAKDILARCLQQGSGLNKACAIDDEDDPAYNVLSDAFSVLASKSIRPRRRNDDTESEGVPKNEALRLKVRGALIDKVSRKHLLEHMLPMLVQIREILKANRSPLIQSLMDYFVVVFRLFPDEVKDNLSLKHPILLQEIQFDAKRNAPNLSMTNKEATVAVNN